MSRLFYFLAGAFLILGFTMIDGRETAPADFGGNRITQVAVVVDDIEQTAQAYAALLGVDVPEVIVTDTYDRAHTQFNGRATEARAKLAFFNLENITIELIEPVGEPSIWKQDLDRKGPGLHHIAFNVPDMQAAIARLEEQGGTLVQQGDFTGGSYAYVDSAKPLGVTVELLTND